MKHYLFFDLDGTLTDSAEGIINSVLYALNLQHWNIPDADALRHFIGPPLIESFQSIAGMNFEQAEQAVRDYRTRYADIGLFENRVYDGIIPMLKTLRDAGKTLYLVTSKPEPYARRIAERFAFAEYLDEICGATLDGSINSKEAVVRMALQRAGQPDVSDVEMIGDRLHDIEGSRACGIDCTYVLYGFGTLEEAQTYHAAHILDTVEHLTKHLLTL